MVKNSQLPHQQIYFKIFFFSHLIYYNHWFLSPYLFIHAVNMMNFFDNIRSMCMQFTMHTFSIIFKVVIVCRPHPLQFSSILIFILPCRDKLKSIFNKIKWKYILSCSDKFKSIFQQNRGGNIFCQDQQK